MAQNDCLQNGYKQPPADDDTSSSTDRTMVPFSIEARGDESRRRSPTASCPSYSSSADDCCRSGSVP